MFRGFFWGLVAGAIAGLLYAPQKGDQTRAQLQTRWNEFQNEAQTKVTDLKAKSSDLIEQGRQTVNSTMNKTPTTANTSANSTSGYATDTTAGSNL